MSEISEGFMETKYPLQFNPNIKTNFRFHKYSLKKMFIDMDKLFETMFND